MIKDVWLFDGTHAIICDDDIKTIYFINTNKRSLEWHIESISNKDISEAIFNYSDIHVNIVDFTEILYKIEDFSKMNITDFTFGRITYED